MSKFFTNIYKYCDFIDLNPHMKAPLGLKCGDSIDLPSLALKFSFNKDNEIGKD